MSECSVVMWLLGMALNTQAFQALDGLNKLMHSPYSHLEVNVFTGMFSIKCICQLHGGKTRLC